MPPDEKTTAPSKLGAPPPSSSPTPTTTTKQKPGHAHCITGRRHIGRYASGWRDGFRAGAADALRVAGRHLPPETWHAIEALADAYELAADD
jgi:hypothetical protein